MPIPKTLIRRVHKPKGNRIAVLFDRSIDHASRTSEVRMAEMPKQILGQPVKYFRKEIIRSGSYVHPIKKYEFNVTAERQDLWAKEYQRWLKNGNKVHLPPKHRGYTAKDNMGYCIGLERAGDSTYAIIQAIGDDAHKAVARNDVSISVIGPDENETHVKDGLGKKYEEVIDHIAITPHPVAPGLKGFELIAASCGLDDDEPNVFEFAATKEAPMELTKEQLANLRKFIGAEKDVDDDAVVTQLFDFTKGKTLKNVNETVTSGAQLSKDLDKVKGELKDAKTHLAELSAEDDELDPRTSNLLNRAVNAERSVAIAAGAITPGVADELDKIFRPSGKLNRIALSVDEEDDNGDILLQRVYSVIAKNTGPARMKGKTSSQLASLSRETPGEGEGAGDDDKAEQAAIDRAMKGVLPIAAKL